MQARRDLNPQHPVLETGALPIRATGLLISTALSRFLMLRVLITEGAVLLVFYPFRMQSLILGRIVIASFTFAASQYYFISGHISILPKAILLYNFPDDAGADRTTAFTNRKSQLFLHRDRRYQLARNRNIVARHYHLYILR